MSGTVVSDWFGPAFAQLHPLLQSLHRHGGKLRGPVGIGFGRGLAGIAGRRLARRLGIPRDGDSHMLEVTIGHDDAVMHWDRRFDDGHCFASTFRPYGHWPDGGWIEVTSAISLRLQVDVIDGGWYWRCVGAQRGHWSIPRWLWPRSDSVVARVAESIARDACLVALLYPFSRRLSASHIAGLQAHLDDGLPIARAQRAELGTDRP
jgi:hypothetical protein